MNKDLAREAAYVGLGFVPVFLGTSAVLDSMFPKDSPLRSEAGKAMVSGIAFHLLAEKGGLNDWYVRNGVAAKKYTAGHYSSTMNFYSQHNGYYGGYGRLGSY